MDCEFFYSFPFMDWNSLWSFLIVVGTFLLAYIAWEQFSSLNNTSTEEFIHKLKKDFFTKEARDLFTLIQMGALSFVDLPEINDKIFKINISNNLVEYLQDSVNVQRKYYSTQEVDDYLLQHFEDIGLLYKKGIIGIIDIDQQFEGYIKVVFEDEQIKNYISWIRQLSDDSDIYSNFEMIYHEVEKYEKETSKSDYSCN